MSVGIFEAAGWQMSLGERAAVEGVLSQLTPSLALEIGSAEGGCLRRIAAHAAEVHSFDLQEPSLSIPDHVTLHVGDSHELLPRFLAELAAQDRNVDFVIVDGDHTPAGVRRDIEDLLDSRAIARTVILIHDTTNERVREGVDAVRFSAWPKVVHVELDFVPGQLFAEPALRNELWYGLGLVLVDSTQPAYDSGPVFEQRYHPAAPLLAHARDWVQERELVASGGLGASRMVSEATERDYTLETELVLARAHAAAQDAELEGARQRLDGAERALENIKGSLSWRITEPLRLAKRRAQRPPG